MDGLVGSTLNSRWLIIGAKGEFSNLLIFLAAWGGLGLVVWFGNQNSVVSTAHTADKGQSAREKGWTALNQGQYPEAKKQFEIAFQESAGLAAPVERHSSTNTFNNAILADRAILARIENLGSSMNPVLVQSAESQIDRFKNGLTELAELALNTEENHQQGLAASYWALIAKQAKSKLRSGERDDLFALALANTSLGTLDASLRKVAKTIDQVYLDKGTSLELLDKTYFEGLYLSRIGKFEDATSTLKGVLDGCLFMPYERRAEQAMVALYRIYRERKQFYEAYDLAVDGPAYADTMSGSIPLPKEMLNSELLKAVYLAQLADFYSWMLEDGQRTRAILATNPALAAEIRNKDFAAQFKKAANESLLLTEVGSNHMSDLAKNRAANILKSKALSLLCTQADNKSLLALRLACALESGTADSVINGYCDLARSESATKDKSDVLMNGATDQLAASSPQIIWLSDLSLDAFANFGQSQIQPKTQNSIASALQASADAAESKYGKDSLQHCLQLRALGRFWLVVNPAKASAPLVQAWNVVRVSKTFPLAARHDILEEYLEMLRKTGKPFEAKELEPLLQAISQS